MVGRIDAYFECILPSSGHHVYYRLPVCQKYRSVIGLKKIWRDQWAGEALINDSSSCEQLQSKCQTECSLIIWDCDLNWPLTDWNDLCPTFKGCISSYIFSVCCFLYADVWKNAILNTHRLWWDLYSNINTGIYFPFWYIKLKDSQNLKLLHSVFGLCDVCTDIKI